MTPNMTDAELAKIKHLLKTAYCNPLWRKHISALIVEVDRLKKTQNGSSESQHSSVGEDRDFLNDTVFL